LKVDGQNYWLWLDYDEPNIHVFVCYFIYLKKELFFYAISSLDR
jgi:hypothetical protein